MSLYLGDIPIANGGASRNIGEIVQSTIPLTDAGLHLADGSLISGSGSYSGFVTHMAGLVSTNPELFASGYESETSVGSVISGGDHSGYPKANAFDDSTSTFWCSSQKGSTNILGYSYIGRSGLTKSVKKVRMMQGFTDQTVNYCSQLLFQYSNDGTTWIDITSISDGANLTWQEWVLPDYTPTGDTHSFRILAYGGFSGSTSNSWCVAEVELYYWSAAGSEAVWQQAVSDYGVCGKYVYDSVNNTIRLPKYDNKIYTKSNSTTALVKGSGKALGLTNGTYNYGLAQGGSGGIAYQSAYNTAFGTSISGSGLVGNMISLGVTTNATNSGLIADLSGMSATCDVYYYVVIATSTKTNIEVDIDEIATDLNGKADIDFSNVSAPAQVFKDMSVNWSMPDYSRALDISSSVTTTSTQLRNYPYALYLFIRVEEANVGGGSITFECGGVSLTIQGEYYSVSSLTIPVPANTDFKLWCPTVPGSLKEALIVPCKEAANV